MASFKVTMFGNDFSLSILCDGRIANLQISGSHQSKYESTDLLLKIAVSQDPLKVCVNTHSVLVVHI